MKSSGGGGISDGGVLCERASLSQQNTIFGPSAGTAWGGFNAAGVELMPASVQAINFDTDIGVNVEEYLILENGTELKTGEVFLDAQVGSPPSGPPDDNAEAVKACSPFFEGGGILAYPNKLAYRLSMGYGETELPSARVLLHFDVVEYDLPKDQ
jgi:hypothetical protein